MPKKKKEPTKIVDVNELDASVAEVDSETKRNELPQDEDPVVPDLKKAQIRTDVPDTDLIIERTKADPNFKRQNPDELSIEATVYTPKANQVIKRMELPEYGNEIKIDPSKLDIRSRMPQIPEGATDSVAYVPGIETREVIKSNAGRTPDTQVVVTPEGAQPDITNKVTVTSTDRHADISMTVETSGGAVYLSTQEGNTFKGSIKKPSEELNSLMDRATVSAQAVAKPVEEISVDNENAKVTTKKTAKKKAVKKKKETAKK